MKKNDFMQRLSDELQKRNVADAADILQEYEAHFAMKMADGYIEEEIAARLGDPTALAAQFDDAEETPEKKGGSKPLVVAGLCFADVFAGLFFILLAAWGLVLAAAALGAAGTAVCLLGKVELGGLLPELPYWCGAMLALTLAALAVLLAAGVRVLLRIPAAAYALLRTIQEKRTGLGLRRGGAAPAAHQPAVFPESKTAAAYRGAGGAGTVCGVLRAGVLRVRPVGGKRAILARVGLVCEMTSAEKTCKEIACGRFFCFWNNN